MKSWESPSRPFSWRGADKGAALLESLISLLILSLVLAVCGTGVHYAVLNLGRMQQAYADEYVFLKTAGLLRGVMADLDSHTLPILPRVHKQGWLQFTDGSSNPVVHSRAHAPDPHADAVTGLALETLAAQEVRQSVDYGWHTEFYACPRFAQRADTGEDLSFVGVLAEGLVELRGRSAARSGEAECRDLALRAVKSMSIAGDQSLPLTLVRLIIPVRRHYTLYVDLNGQLRWLSHRGDSNVENQPLLKKVGGLSLAAGSVFDGAIQMLSGSIGARGGERRLSVMNRLGRFERFNLLLNRP